MWTIYCLKVQACSSTLTFFLDSHVYSKKMCDKGKEEITTTKIRDKEKRLYYL